MLFCSVREGATFAFIAARMTYISQLIAPELVLGLLVLKAALTRLSLVLLRRGCGPTMSRTPAAPRRQLCGPPSQPWRPPKAPGRRQCC